MTKNGPPRKITTLLADPTSDPDEGSSDLQLQESDNEYWTRGPGIGGPCL